MSYTLEVYRGNQKAERHFGIYALYVMFYPQLVAGPIERPQNLLPQFHKKHEFKYHQVVEGLKLMAWGLFKKIVIADRLAHFVDDVFENPYDHHGSSLILATIFFSFQLYCDFSGYTDIAIGAARVIGFDLMKNFNSPFSSKSITEFWRRWHISLSTWFNDYLFTPLIVANRDWGKFSVIFALVFTFFISGLWHGAGWTFIIYGLLHGVGMIYEFLTKKYRKKISKLIPNNIYDTISILITFTYVSFSWVFFRAKSINIALYIIKNSVTGLGTDFYNLLHFNFHLDMKIDHAEFFIAWASVFLLIAVDYLASKKNISELISQQPYYVRYAIYYSFIFLLVTFCVSTDRQFIYFQF